MDLVEQYSLGGLATVFVGRTSLGHLVEFAEATQPPLSREEKEVILVSTMAGCPVGCQMCDAGSFYEGKLTAKEMFEQIDAVVLGRYGRRAVSAKKFKIQFARMGEPALNDSVLDVLDLLPYQYEAHGLLPSVSTTAPLGCDHFFGTLLEIKERHYRGRFQLQFSAHSTDDRQRAERVPIKKWDLRQIGRYGEAFVKEGDKKVSLNFALSKESLVDPEILAEMFDPDRFLIKITPLNPTYKVVRNRLISGVDVAKQGLPFHPDLPERLDRFGFEVILSIGESEENGIGSNCGQSVLRHLREETKIREGYGQVV